MVEYEFQLLGYKNPHGNLFPTPPVAFVGSGEVRSLIYPDGTRETVDTPDITEVWAKRNGVTLLQAPYRIPFRPGHLLCGLDKEHIIYGDSETIVGNLKIHLSTLRDSNGTIYANLISHMVQSLETTGQQT